MRFASAKDLFTKLDAETDPLKRKVFLIGFLFEELSKRGVDVCLVGGEAVELYTGGQFSTGDIDITVSDRSLAEKILKNLGFQREGMIWLNKRLKVAFQIVASYPSHREKVRVVKAQGLSIKVVGVEDLIVDRLVAAKYWRSNPKLDTEQALVLFRNFKNSLDLSYLKQRTEEEKVDDILDEIQKLAK